MKWLVKVETIWVFNLLIEMMNYVFYMKRAIFKKIYLRMGNKKLDKKKKKLECSI